MSVFPHAAGFIGLPAVFRVMKELPSGKALPGQSPVDGPIDTQLATSVDGRTWERSWPRLAMIPRGAPGTFDAGAILGVASVPLHTADQTWVFYTALSTGHGGPLPTKRITIGRADWRLHGFVSLDAGPEGGRIETVPLRWSGAELLINADASRGQVRIALLDANEKGNPRLWFSGQRDFGIEPNSLASAVEASPQNSVRSPRSCRRGNEKHATLQPRHRQQVAAAELRSLDATAEFRLSLSAKHRASSRIPRFIALVFCLICLREIQLGLRLNHHSASRRRFPSSAAVQPIQLNEPFYSHG